MCRLSARMMYTPERCSEALAANVDVWEVMFLAEQGQRAMHLLHPSNPNSHIPIKMIKWTHLVHLVPWKIASLLPPNQSFPVCDGLLWVSCLNSPGMKSWRCLSSIATFRSHGSRMQAMGKMLQGTIWTISFACLRFTVSTCFNMFQLFWVLTSWAILTRLSSPYPSAKELLIEALPDERLSMKERKLCKHGHRRLVDWNEAMEKLSLCVRMCWVNMLWIFLS